MVHPTHTGALIAAFMVAPPVFPVKTRANWEGISPVTLTAAATMFPPMRQVANPFTMSIW